MTISAANLTRQVFVVLMRQSMTVGIVVTFPPNENPHRNPNVWALSASRDAFCC